ncbi:MAG: VOC family protein [Candidatus Cloacimonetes bacterium]|nr:VOC family protein [Candidatus Cloacimonadota bacterium]MCF7814939.1 VOC family protein [Candidatus Cloacimonadota bacterium]MCF7867329.1 VOC family protein [Candidatus Cloacimonadota bacterium]MCF7882763.1 VOC family protein [Candidatus Cloacimonadota bacterium]
MSGIVFFRTNKLEEMKDFYMNKCECKMWMDQGDCCILQHDNFLIGFCSRDTIETQGMITFYFENKEEVDRFYTKFRDSADDVPRDNPRYPIYHFFAKDPEGRILEFQYFYNL